MRAQLVMLTPVALQRGPGFWFLFLPVGEFPTQPIGEFPMAKKEKEPEISGAPSAVEQATAAETVSAPPVNDSQIALPIGADDLAGPLAEGMPMPTDAAVAPPTGPESIDQPPSVERRDVNGTVFDPAKHRKDAFGNPVIKDGRFLSNRGTESRRKKFNRRI